MLSHSVYFSLNDNSPANIENLVQACHKYLKDHPGVEFFAAGTLGTEFQRAVNDRDFDVALLVVFKDKESHDLYQQAADHQTFIDQQQPGWKQVRVFDAWVD